MLALLVPVVVFVGLDLAFAADLPAVPGEKSYMPSYATMDMFLLSILIGLAAGLITGCIGAFKAIEKKCLKQDLAEEALFAKKVQTRGFEPAYNFSGIPRLA
ncbi:MAG: hypothetical protein ACUVRC_10615 [Desulfotomaculales bacterium]